MFDFDMLCQFIITSQSALKSLGGLLVPYLCSPPPLPFSAAPSKPKGPLKVSDVTAKHCKLSWNKPEDDGGAPITAYAVEKMDTSTPGKQSWRSWCAEIILLQAC